MGFEILKQAGAGRTERGPRMKVQIVMTREVFDCLVALVPDELSGRIDLTYPDGSETTPTQVILDCSVGAAEGLLKIALATDCRDAVDDIRVGISERRRARGRDGLTAFGARGGKSGHGQAP